MEIDEVIPFLQMDEEADYDNGSHENITPVEGISHKIFHEYGINEYHDKKLTQFR